MARSPFQHSCATGGNSATAIITSTGTLLVHSLPSYSVVVIVRIQLPTTIMQPPNEFLSGEGDPKIGSILDVGSLQIDSKDNAAATLSNQSNAKIQIMASMESSSLIPPPPRNSSSIDSFSDGESESPPPLDANRTIESSTSTRNHQANDSGNNSTNDNDSSVNQEESLMEQMMKEALKAKKENDEKKNTSIRKDAKQSFGLKKGFLNTASSSSSSKTKSKSKQTKENPLQTKLKSKLDREPVYELDSEGNMIPLIPKSTATSTRKNPLHLDEVQESMNASSNTFASNWSTSPDLLQRISSDPILFKDMTNPKYTAALEALQRDPKEAMKRFENHPDVKDFLNRMCRVLGDHFTELGEKQDQEQEQVKEQEKKTQGHSKDVKEKDVGPLAYSALQKEKLRQEQGKESFDKMSKTEQDQVDTIMKDQELTRILMDVDMQRVMQECSTIPGKMKMYMSHDVHGAKLRKLIQAGLLRMA